MKQWLVLWKKEMLELWRSLKWIWVPIVFILLGALQPVSIYYLPRIIDSVGNVPEGAVIDFPMPGPEYVLANTLSQFNTIGLLVLVLACMGMVASERNSGIAGMILVKPVSYLNYISAKWAAACILTIVSLFLGQSAAWYYTRSLIGDISYGLVAGSIGLYALWLCFVITLAIFFSSLLKSSGATAFLSLLGAIFVSVLTSTFPDYTKWTPGTLGGHANDVLMSVHPPTEMWLPIAGTIVCIAVLIAGATAVLRRKELVG